MNNIIDHKLKKKKYRWLITGVAGFIGANLLETLLTYDQNVVGLDNFSSGNKKNIQYVLKNIKKKNKHKKNSKTSFKLIIGDIRNLKDCKKALKNIDIVLHQAALGSIPRSIKNPIETNSVNVGGFLHVLNESYLARVKSFVYASSSSVYGDNKCPIKDECLELNPKNPYATTKYINEVYADIYSKVYKFNTTGLRYFNIYGKLQNSDGPYAAVIPKWINLMNKNSKCLIYGDGSTSRDFCHVSNAVQMNLLSALKKFEQHEVFNVAANKKTSLNKLFKIIQKSVIKHRTKNIKLHEPIYKEFRLGDIKHSRATIVKASKRVSYVPMTDIREGIDETVKWFLDSKI